jgi:hypothetical protein
MSRRDGHGQRSWYRSKEDPAPVTALAKVLPNQLCLLTIDNNMRFLRPSPTCICITNKHVIQ